MRYAPLLLAGMLVAGCSDSSPVSPAPESPPPAAAMTDADLLELAGRVAVSPEARVLERLGRQVAAAAERAGIDPADIPRLAAEDPSALAALRLSPGLVVALQAASSALLERFPELNDPAFLQSLQGLSADPDARSAVSMDCLWDYAYLGAVTVALSASLLACSDGVLVSCAAVPMLYMEWFDAFEEAVECHMEEG